MTFLPFDPMKANPVLIDAAKVIIDAYRTESLYAGYLMVDEGVSVESVLANAPDFIEEPFTSLARPVYSKTPIPAQQFNDFQEEVEIARDLEHSLRGILNDAGSMLLPDSFYLSDFIRRGKETSDIFSMSKVKIPDGRSEVWIITLESNCQAIHELAEIKSKLSVVTSVKGEIDDVIDDALDSEFPRLGLPLTYRVRHALSGERFIIWPINEYKKESCIFVPGDCSLILYSNFDNRSFPKFYEVDFRETEAILQDPAELRLAKNTCAHLIWRARSMLRSIKNDSLR